MLFPRERSGRPVHVTGYQTVADVRDVSTAATLLNGAILLVYEGELTFDEFKGRSEIESVDEQLRIGMGEMSFGITKRCRWLLLV